MSESNRTRILFGEEPTPSAAPGTPLTELRWTSESLGQTTDSTTSPEVRDDAQITDVIRTNVAAQGELGIVWSYGTYDPFLPALLRGSWGGMVVVEDSNTISAVAGTRKFLDSANLAFADFEAGDWIEFRGFTGAAVVNNNVFQIVTKTGDGDITVLGTVANASVGTPITVFGEQLTNGVVERSFLLEKQYRGVTPNEFLSFPYSRLGSGGMQINAGQLVTGTLGFQGTRAVPGSATVGTGTPVAASQTEVMNSIDNVAHIREAGELVTLEVAGIEWGVDNNLRRRGGVGVLGSSSIRYGTMNVTGTLRVYFANADLYKKQLSFQPTDLSFVARGDGGAYAFYWPSIKFTGDPIPKAGGLDQDLMVELPFTAYRDAELGYTMRVARFPEVLP